MKLRWAMTTEQAYGKDIITFVGPVFSDDGKKLSLWAHVAPIMQDCPDIHFWRVLSGAAGLVTSGATFGELEAKAEVERVIRKMLSNRNPA